MRTGFSYDPVFLDHDTGAGHPECKERLQSTIDYLSGQNRLSELINIESRYAGIDQIEQVHSSEYIERARQTCLSGGLFLDSPDVTISRNSFDIALKAAGSGLQLADAVVANNIDNGFGLLRPPGHHAEKGMALGFCVFNNIAVLARYLQKTHGLDKILILDWDVHHGNGTQHLFEQDPSVLYISTHQFPFYPGTGRYDDTGTGRGTGATLNCPMSAGASDTHYTAAFNEKILPKINEFRPEIILISAGFDAHADDPLADIRLSTQFYSCMTEWLMEKAEKYCQGKIISLLEGGYNLQRLPECIDAHLTQLLSDH